MDGVKGNMRLIPALLVIAACSLMCPSAMADCDRPRMAAPALERASIAFRGLAREVKAAGVAGSWRGWIVTFTVFTVWKGEPPRDFTLYVSGLGEDDAYEEFRRGEQYVVFAALNPTVTSARFGIRGLTYGAHGCGGTGPVAHSTSYLKELGPGRPLS